MNKTLNALFAACLLAAAPFTAAEGKTDSFEATLAQMPPEQKVPLAKLLIAKADADIQTSLKSNTNIEKANIQYEEGNVVKYTIHMRHNKKMADMLTDSNSKQLFGQFIGNALNQYICKSSSKQLKSLHLVGIERIRIHIYHDEQSISDSSFAIQECL